MKKIGVALIMLLSLACTSRAGEVDEKKFNLIKPEIKEARSDLEEIERLLRNLHKRLDKIESVSAKEQDVVEESKPKAVASKEVVYYSTPVVTTPSYSVQTYTPPTYNYNYTYSQPAYTYTQPTYNYTYSQPAYNYNYSQPTYNYDYAAASFPAYNYGASRGGFFRGGGFRRGGGGGGSC